MLNKLKELEAKSLENKRFLMVTSSNYDVSCTNHKATGENPTRNEQRLVARMYTD